LNFSIFQISTFIQEGIGNILLPAKLAFENLKTNLEFAEFNHVLTNAPSHRERDVIAIKSFSDVIILRLQARNRFDK